AASTGRVRTARRRACASPAAPGTGTTRRARSGVRSAWADNGTAPRSAWEPVLASRAMRRPVRACILLAFPLLVAITTSRASARVGGDEAPGGEVGPGREQPPALPGGEVRVPQDAPTIQAAVDRAEPGGIVLISPGVYEEAVVVRTPFL